MGVNSTKAIMDYIAAPFGDGSPSRKATTQEMKEFKLACTAEEWEGYGKQAAAALGVEWEPTKAA